MDFILSLGDQNQVQLDILQSRNFRLSEDMFDRYGDVLKWLEDPRKVTVTGTWTTVRDTVQLRLNTVLSGKYRDDIQAEMTLVPSGGNYRVSSWDTQFFGRSNRPVFEKQASRNNSGDLLAGLAVVAAGAVIIGESGHSSAHEDWGRAFRQDIDGRGNCYFGNREATSVTGVLFSLDDKGAAEIITRGGYEVRMVGKWSSRGSSYQVTIRDIYIDGRSVSGYGSGTIYMKRDGATVSTFSANMTINDSRRRADLSFMTRN